MNDTERSPTLTPGGATDAPSRNRATDYDTGGRSSTGRVLGRAATVAVAVAVVLAPTSGVIVPAGGSVTANAAAGNATAPPDAAVTAATDSNEVIDRGGSKGELIEQPDDVKPGDTASVTGKVTATKERNEDDIIWGVVGYANGTVLSVDRMSSLGSGTVSSTFTVAEDPAGEKLVWSYYPVYTADSARESFKNDAEKDRLTDGDRGIVFETFGDGSGNGTTPIDAEFTVDRSGGLVQVLASATASEAAIASYEWDFGDGATARGVTATHRYTESGTFTITLTVTDEEGRTATVTKTVEIGGSSGGNATDDHLDLRSIEYGETATGYVDGNDSFAGEYLGGFRHEPVTFTGSKGDVVRVTIDPNEAGRFGAIRVRGPSGLLNRTETGAFVLPADGQYTIQAGFIGTAPGQYDLTLRRVGGEAPSVTFDVAGDPVVNSSVSFEATASGDDEIVSYEWDFGDGTGGTGATPSHTFAQTGTYTVTVTVTDEQGDTATASQEIRVETELQGRFDDNDDGSLDMGELQQALKAVKRGGDDDITLEEIREKIERLDGDGSDGDGSDESDGPSDSDGLSDEREKHGIPVLHTYELAKAGEQANVTDPPKNDYPGFVLEFVSWLKTDPGKADTDGDGLSDSTEVGTKLTLDTGDVAWLPSSYDGNVTVYVLNSDPTDPNTDDAGLTDKREGKVGSDPTAPEYISVSAYTPVFAKPGCDPGDPPNPKNCIDETLRGDDADAGLKLVDEFNNRKGKNPDSQAWLKGIQDSELQNQRTYYLVAVTITGTAKNVPASVKSEVDVQFTKFGHYSSRIVGAGPSKSGVEDGWVFEPWGRGNDGEVTAYLVVESSYEQDDPRWQDLGPLTMEVTIPSSPYARGGGRETVTITSTRQFAVDAALPLTSRGEAKELVAEGTRKFAKGVVSAAFPATAGGIGAQAFYQLTGAAAAATLITAEGMCLFTGVGKAPSAGPDDLAGAVIAGQGAVPTYLENGDERPTTGFVFTVHRAN